MTEAEWLASADPAAMLAYLRRLDFQKGHGASPISARKLRLFACACCRQVWDAKTCPRCKGSGKEYHATTAGTSSAAVAGVPMRVADCYRCGGSGRAGGLTDPCSRRAVEVAERYADNGGKTAHERSEMHAELFDANRADPYRDPWLTVLPESALEVPILTDRLVLRAIHAGVPPAVQAALLRCIFGDPWRPVQFGCNGEHGAAKCPRCRVLRWNDGVVSKLAERIYAERRWADLPILADALEEAGCDDADILAHCRGGSEHAPGCWVVDLLLGKE